MDMRAGALRIAAALMALFPSRLYLWQHCAARWHRAALRKRAACLALVPNALRRALYQRATGAALQHRLPRGARCLWRLRRQRKARCIGGNIALTPHCLFLPLVVVVESEK
jgi:hypothetical protein